MAAWSERLSESSGPALEPVLAELLESGTLKLLLLLRPRQLSADSVAVAADSVAVVVVVADVRELEPG